MSFLKKLMGSDIDSLIKEAREKEAEGDPGGALLDYRRALDGMKDTVFWRGTVKESSQVKEISQRVMDLEDGLADGYLAEAQGLIGEHELEKAVESLQLALDVAGSEDKQDVVRRKLESLQIMIADSEVVTTGGKMTEEEIYQAFSGAWTQQQLDEFDGYGEKFKRAYLDFHGGKFDDALSVYKELLEGAGEDALYLRLECARTLYLKAQSLAEKKEEEETVKKLRDEAIETVHEFRQRLPMKRNPEVRAGAWSLLAQIFIDKKDLESAEDALMEAQNIVPGEPVVYLNLGRFLFYQDRTDDAIYALEQGEKLMDKFQPNIEILLLLGMAHRKAGNLEAATVRLQAIIDYYMVIGRHEWDPAVALPLAELYEETGKTREASDIYRNISKTGVKENLAENNYNAARLMKKLGMKKEEIHPYVLRAREHVADEDLKKKIEDLDV